MKSSKCELCLYRVKLGVLFLIGTADLQGDYLNLATKKTDLLYSQSIDFKNCNNIKGMCGSVSTLYQIEMLTSVFSHLHKVGAILSC